VDYCPDNCKFGDWKCDNELSLKKAKYYLKFKYLEELI